jgi:hypothetical protein
MTHKTRYYPDRQRHSPTRSVAWRWYRAINLVKRGRHATRRRDDELTIQAVHYLRRVQRYLDDASRHARLAAEHPSIYAAHQLHGDGDVKAVELEARLLAGQATDVIDSIVGVSRDVVETYEALFFNVRDRLHARDWITAAAVGWWPFDPARGRDARTVLRAFAYHGGPLILDAVLPYLLEGRLRLPPSSDTSTPEGQFDRVIRAAIELETLPWGAKVDQRLMQINATLLEAKKKASVERRNHSIVAANVVEVLDKVAAGALQEGAAKAQPSAAVEPPASFDATG